MVRAVMDGLSSIWLFANARERFCAVRNTVTTATRRIGVMALRKRSDTAAHAAAKSHNVPEPPPRPNLTETELQDLRTAFGLLDRNCDGQVTVAELQFMLRNLGFEFPDDVVHHLISEASHSGNGLIDEAEFFQWIGRIQSLRQDSETEAAEDEITKDLIAAFRVFDRDGNGYITKDELKSAMDVIGETVTEEQLNEMLIIADIDKDGKINYEEFARLLL